LSKQWVQSKHEVAQKGNQKPVLNWGGNFHALVGGILL